MKQLISWFATQKFLIPSSLINYCHSNWSLYCSGKSYCHLHRMGWLHHTELHVYFCQHAETSVLFWQKINSQSPETDEDRISGWSRWERNQPFAFQLTLSSSFKSSTLLLNSLSVCIILRPLPSFPHTERDKKLGRGLLTRLYTNMLTANVSSFIFYGTLIPRPHWSLIQEWNYTNRYGHDISPRHSSQQQVNWVR